MIYTNANSKDLVLVDCVGQQIKWAMSWDSEKEEAEIVLMNGFGGTVMVPDLEGLGQYKILTVKVNIPGAKMVQKEELGKLWPLPMSKEDMEELFNLGEEE